MIVEPKVKGFICTTAHPAGCEESVRRQIEYVKSHGKSEGFKNVLVIGASTGYGLASRINAAFKCGANTLGIAFEKEASKNRTATPGFYNTRAFEKFAKEEGLYAKSLNGDAFSKEMKEEAVKVIKEDLKQVDMVVYSLAAPRRTTADNITHVSVLKTVGSEFTNKTLDLRNNEITTASLPPATEEEIEATVKVMGGEDWKDWIKYLKQEGVLADNAVTIAYSYIGPEITYPIYKDGTIGQAKKHLCNTMDEINKEIEGVKAYVSVNKALVTQASAAIPVVPLYISILYKVMKDMGIHEGCIEQMERLFRERLLSGDAKLDSERRIRLDDWEMREDVQSKVFEYWNKITTENVTEYADIDGYWKDFYNMFGFGYDNIDYTEDVSID